MVDDRQPKEKPATPDSPTPNDAPTASDTPTPNATGSKDHVTRPRQGTDKVAAEADETAEFGDELGGPA